MIFVRRLTPSSEFPSLKDVLVGETPETGRYENFFTQTLGVFNKIFSSAPCLLPSLPLSSLESTFLYITQLTIQPFHAGLSAIVRKTYRQDYLYD